jgi:hypothetical protein
MNQENLYTAGSEFKLPNGKFYVGKYHINSSVGAMVGAKHTPGNHDVLIPATKKAKDKVERIQKQRRSTLGNSFSRRQVSQPRNQAGQPATRQARTGPTGLSQY